MVWLLLLSLLSVDAPAEFRSVRLLATAGAGARVRSGPDFEAPGEPRRQLGGWRGLERVIGAERTVRTLLVDCGDFAVGSAEATASWGRAAVRFMNLAGYDAAAVGPHDFTWGVHNLEILARSAAFPLLADPMLDVVLNRQVPLFRPWVVLDLRGVSVALVGLSDLDPPGVDAYAPGSPAEQLRRYLPALAAHDPDLTVAFGRLTPDEGLRLLDAFPGLALVVCPDDGSGIMHERLLLVPRHGQRLAVADLLVGPDDDEASAGGRVIQAGQRSINVLPADSGSAALERLIAEFRVAGEDSAGPFLAAELSPLLAAAALAEACRSEVTADVVLLPVDVVGSALRAGRPLRHELRSVVPREDRLRLVILHDTLLHALARSGGPDSPAPMVAGAELFVMPGAASGWPNVSDIARLRLAGRGPARRVVTTERFLLRSGIADQGRLLPQTLTGLWIDHVESLDTLPVPELPRRVRVGPGVTPVDPLVAELVNINTADVAALEQLPGVGPKTAERIIGHRTEFGPFRSVEELANVRGIGPKTVERLRPLVTVR